MRSYRWWQRILAERFFGPDQDGRPVLLFIDDEVAESLHREATPEERIDDLCTAVAEEAIDWRGRAFDQVYEGVLAWKTRGEHEQPPPCLPLLAVCVLAATRMKGTGGRGARPYYQRLAEILHPSIMVSGIDVEKHLERDHSTVADLWRYLDEWLDERDGRNGLSTLYATKGRERIGYAQSQAITCAADNDRLMAFFKDHRGKTGRELLKNVQRWSGRQHLSRALREALDTPERHRFLAELLFALSVTASDERPIPKRSRRLRLRVGAEYDMQRGWILQWKAARVPGVDDDALEHKAGTLRVAAVEDKKYYRLSGQIPDVADALRDGIKATGARLAIGLSERTRLLVLQQDPLGGWTETDRPEPSQRSLIVYSKAMEHEARELLDRAGYEWDEAWETTAPGWYYLDDIEFDESGAPRRRALRLGGGLHVRQKHEKHHFMMGGEPDLIAPLDVGIVTLDDRPISTGSSRARLRGRGLEPGEHSVQLDGHSLTFYIHAPQRPEGVATASKGTSDRKHATASIDADGRFTSLRPTVTPLWWRTRDTGLTGVGSRVKISESAVWLVTENSHGHIEVQLLRAEEPRIRRMTTAMKEFWSMMFTARPRPADRRLWNKYRKMALETSMRND